MIRNREIEEKLKKLQDEICAALEKLDGKARFAEDNWERPEGGGGRTRVIQDGNVFEKGGVNFSAVYGKAPAFLKKEMAGRTEADEFFATGVSIVIHPKNPRVPIIHMNVRYFEMDERTRWVGGGIDLTPHYIVPEEARFFHRSVKDLCDRFSTAYYPEFKQQADDYFFIPHRQETRGIGGIFFDKLEETASFSMQQRIDFILALGGIFAPVYSALVEKNKERPYGEQEKQWQLLRRGRYVEFNLVYDRGTKFGLETNGRTESILMSLPKMASWVYDYTPGKDSEEENTLLLLKKGINWTEA